MAPKGLPPPFRRSAQPTMGEPLSLRTPRACRSLGSAKSHQRSSREGVGSSNRLPSDIEDWLHLRPEPSCFPPVLPSFDHDATTSYAFC